MKLYWAPQTRSARALWMLEEIGQPYERELIEIKEGTARPDALLAASPMGKVPALVDGEASLSESAAICLYLADRYSLGNLAPALDSAERGKFLYWMMYVPGVIEPAMAEKFGGWEANKYSHGWGDYESMIETLVSALTGKEWLVGDKFTAADVMIGSTCYFMKKFNILPDNDVLDAYVARCLERPAYQTALKIDVAG
ncbi:glutathione S-transferase [Kordiimonas sp. SCSIO 12603]|uniref:glutathione S-transferase family protein n=1 Tax=Kordiimonas sp. SCSIO 12603 TaxID=2829596 RepID=UPI00210391D3|nr:glutathione S-transferase [Kordiimonas sp. SCSIO 12603]UTW60131.1 glutathione S-transferase [Kordiimonas sp. SCSIO 12603]